MKISKSWEENYKFWNVLNLQGWSNGKTNRKVCIKHKRNNLYTNSKFFSSNILSDDNQWTHVLMLTDGSNWTLLLHGELIKRKIIKKQTAKTIVIYTPKRNKLVKVRKGPFQKKGHNKAVPLTLQWPFFKLKVKFYFKEFPILTLKDSEPEFFIYEK